MRVDAIYIASEEPNGSIETRLRRMGTRISYLKGGVLQSKRIIPTRNKEYPLYVTLTSMDFSDFTEKHGEFSVDNYFPLPTWTPETIIAAREITKPTLNSTIDFLARFLYDLRESEVTHAVLYDYEVKTCKTQRLLYSLVDRKMQTPQNYALSLTPLLERDTSDISNWCDSSLGNFESDRT